VIGGFVRSPQAAFTTFFNALASETSATGTRGSVLSAAIPATLQAATANVSVDASQTSAFFPRYENYYYADILTRGPLDEANAKKLAIDYLNVFWDPLVWAPSEGVYDFSAYSFYDQRHIFLGDSVSRIARTFSLVIRLMPKWLNSNQWGAPQDQTKYRKMIYDGLKFMKNRYPAQFQYVMVFDEPDGHGMLLADYLATFRTTLSAMQQVNAELPAGVPPLKIEGPGVCSLNWAPGVNFMQGFLDAVKAERFPLDSVTWNSYADYNANFGQMNTPAIFQGQVGLVRGWLSQRGLAGIKTGVTFNSTYNGNLIPYTAGNLAAQASFFMASYDYFMRGQADRAKIGPW
jgi:hypothetical protein